MSEIKKGDRVKVTLEGTVTKVWNWGETEVNFDELRTDDGTVDVDSKLLTKVIPDEPPIGSLVETAGSGSSAAGAGTGHA